MTYDKTKYETSMSRAGFNKGMSMIEVYATRFHQDFDVEDETAWDALSSLIERCDDADDLRHLKLELENTLGFETESDKRHFLSLKGAATWPQNEDVKDTFERGIKAISTRLDHLKSG